MRYELYIDEKRVDLSDDNISLNYKSNLLSDITKIVSNNSYTIKLPKTNNNMALFGHAEMVSSSTRFPYVSHNGILFRDGIEIIRGASVVLLKIGEGIEIALVWNDTQAFNRMVSEGASLRDMPTESERVVWQHYYNHENEYYPIDNLSWGLPLTDENYTAHPCVKVSKILEWMEAYNVVRFNIPEERQSFVNSLIVPLISKEPDASFNDGERLPFKRTFRNATFVNLTYISYDDAGELNPEYGSIANDGLRDSFRVSQDFENITIDLHIALVEADTSKDLSNVKLRLFASTGTSPEREIYYDGVLSRETATGWNIDAVIHITGVNLFANEFLYLSLIVPEGDYSANGNLDMVLSLMPTELKKGDYFPLVKNLPDMKQVDFLKAIAQMAGMYAYPDTSGNITFVTFESLYNNKAIAQDWTNIVVEQEDELARDIEYTLDDMSQRNWYRYKEDSSYRYKTNADAYIQIDNRTLEAENDVVELPFAASLNDYIMAYSYEKGEESSYQGGEDRIFKMYTTEVAGETRYYATFSGLEWSQLLYNHYRDYTNMLRDAKVITEYVKLSSIDLKNVQMNVPVYLGQHGAYFAIVTIVTKENDICEVKLIKM